MSITTLPEAPECSRYKCEQSSTRSSMTSLSTSVADAARRKAARIRGADHHLETSTAVDIGVYRGRSFLPMGAPFQWLGSGTAYGLDPYSATPAADRRSRSRGILLESAGEQDWGATWIQVQAQHDRKLLDPFARLVCETSKDAAAQFPIGSLDLVHIDGNHDRATVELDYELYGPLSPIWRVHRARRHLLGFGPDGVLRPQVTTSH